MDQVSIYNRALSDTEIATIYAAGTAGKCTTSLPPLVHLQPSDQTVVASHTATFSAAVSGAPLLSFQWTFGGTPIAGATSSNLVLTNVQLNQAGNFRCWSAIFSG